MRQKTPSPRVARLDLRRRLLRVVTLRVRRFPRNYLAAVLTASLVAGAPSPAQSQFLAGLAGLVIGGEVLNGSVGDMVSQLDSAVRRWIAAAGATADATILKSLNEMQAKIASTKIALDDSAAGAFEDLEDAQQRLVFDLARQMMELEKLIARESNTFVNESVRFNETLQEVARVRQIPYVLRTDPPAYRAGEQGVVRFAIVGGNLSNIENRLAVGDLTFEPTWNGVERIVFEVPKAALRPDENGRAGVALLARPEVAESFVGRWLGPLWPFIGLFGAKEEPLVFRSEIQAMGPSPARYELVASLRPARGFKTKWTTLSADDPDRAERCLLREAGAIFDPGYTKVETTQAWTRVPAHKVHFPFPFGGSKFRDVPERTVQAPNRDRLFTLKVNTPEKICVELHFPPSKKSISEWVTDRTLRTTTHVEVRILNRVATVSPRPDFLHRGVIDWDHPTDVVLPEGHEGWRLRLTYENAGKSRSTVVTPGAASPEAAWPVRVEFDATSRTLVIAAEDIP